MYHSSFSLLSPLPFPLSSSLSPGEGQLPSEHQKLLTLLEFAHKTQLSHDLSQDILTGKNWNLLRALESAEEMGHSVVTPPASTTVTNRSKFEQSRYLCSLNTKRTNILLIQWDVQKITLIRRVSCLDRTRGTVDPVYNGHCISRSPTL